MKVFLKNFNILYVGTLLQKIGPLSCIDFSRHSAKNSHIIQFPPAIFAKIRENLLVSGLLEVNDLS